MADGLGVDLLPAVEVAQPGQQVAQREALLHHRLGEAEGGGDLGDGAAGPEEPGEGLVLGHLIGIEPGHVLDHRGLDGGGVIAGRQHAAGRGLELAGLMLDRPGREVAPLSGDDLVALAVRPDQERHQDAARPDRG